MPLTLDRPDLLRGAALVGDRWIQGDEEGIAVTNPFDGHTLAHVPRLDRAQVRSAIEAARDAMPAWATRTAKDRGQVLRCWYDALIAHKSDLARIMTAEQGKPLKEAEGEIAYAAAFVEWYAEEGRRAYGDIIPPHQADRRILVIRQPIGVTAAITPWNFPAAMITRKAAPALAAGCPMIVKPAGATPLTAIALAILAEEAGLPPGLLSIVTGKASDIAAEFTSNPIVRKLSFTGSTEVGARLYADAAQHIQKISLELGGNAPFIVLDDADLDAAADGCIASKFRNGGQTCVCANRIYVADRVHDAFVERLKARIEALTVGDGMADGTDIGPLIDADAVEKFDEHIADAKAHGATLITGGEHLDGTMVRPALMTGLTPDAKVATEETFAPLAPVFRFRNDAEAIAQANATRFGLAAYFYGRDIGRIVKMAEALEYGIVGVNTGLISTEVAPFGGWKESGVGREGGAMGLEEYLETKYICLAV